MAKKHQVDNLEPILATLVEHLAAYGQAAGISVPRSRITENFDTKVEMEWGKSPEGIDVLVLRVNK